MHALRAASAGLPIIFGFAGLVAAVHPAWAAQSTVGQPIITDLHASRSDDVLVITGKAQGLPAGTVLWADLLRRPDRRFGAIDEPDDSHVTVAPDGTFAARLPQPDGKLPAGSYGIEFLSHFSSTWQSADVLKQAGVEIDAEGRSDLLTDPKALPASPDFKPDDPEFPNGTRYLDTVRSVVLGAIPPDLDAIAHVKAARLYVKGHGRSRLSVAGTVEEYASAPGFTVSSWSAAAGQNGVWTVKLDCIDGGTPKTAEWRYDSQTGAVNYLDPLSKTLSYALPE